MHPLHPMLQSDPNLFLPDIFDIIILNRRFSIVDHLDFLRNNIHSGHMMMLWKQCSNGKSNIAGSSHSNFVLFHNISPLVLFEPFLISVFIYIHFFLTTSIPLQNRQNRLKQNLNIQSDIPLGNIFCIQADDFFKVCDVASAADLPHSGDSRLDCDSGTVVQLILFQLIGEDGAGSC